MKNKENLTMYSIKPGKYRHHKTQKLYEVIGMAIHSETLEELVVYKALYTSERFAIGQLWVRPATLFLGKIKTQNNEEVARFEYLRE